MAWEDYRFILEEPKSMLAYIYLGKPSYPDVPEGERGLNFTSAAFLAVGDEPTD